MTSDKPENEQQQQCVDYTANCGTPHQRRSSPARRRRTDFSQFLQSSSSNSSSSSDVDIVVPYQGLMKSTPDVESPSSVIITAFDEIRSRIEDVQKHVIRSDSGAHKQLFTGEKPHDCPDKQDSPDSNNVCNESTIRKSARARKLSVRLDKEIILSKSTKQARRIKILRQLGLAPPAGSPFA